MFVFPGSQALGLSLFVSPCYLLLLALTLDLAHATSLHWWIQLCIWIFSINFLSMRTTNKKGAFAVFNWVACITFEALEAFIMNQLTWNFTEIRQISSMRFLVNDSLLLERSFISIYVVFDNLFFRVSLLLCCVSVSAGVPVRASPPPGLLVYWHKWPTSTTQ